MALIIAFHLNRDDSGQQTAFPSHETVMLETGLSRATVQRALGALCDGPWPLYARTNGAKSIVRNGKALRFASTLYALIETDPADFARARDQARAQTIARAKMDIQIAQDDPEVADQRLQLQKARCLDQISAEEYEQGLAQLAASTRPAGLSVRAFNRARGLKASGKGASQ